MTNIEGAIQILRKATATVKVAPFAFALLYLTALVVYLLFNDTIATIADMLFYVSPVAVFFNLRMSKIFKMCKWHRLECLLPLLPIVLVFVNGFGFIIPDIAVYVNWSVNLIIFLLSLLNAYFVFIKPRNEESNS